MATMTGRTLALGNQARRSQPARQSLEAGAVSELQGIARFKFHEGKLEEFKRLAAPTTISPSASSTSGTVGDLNEAILATGYISGTGALLGEPSAEPRAKMADSEVRLFTLYESM